MTPVVPSYYMIYGTIGHKGTGGKPEEEKTFLAFGDI